MKRCELMVLLMLIVGCLWQVKPVRAQVTGSTYNPYRDSSNYWDRQIAAKIDMSSVITRNAQNSAMTNLIASQAGKGGGQSPHQRGAVLIKAGRATNKFAMRPFALNKWLQQWGGSDAQKRAQAKAEWDVQSALWRQEVTRRKANWGDIGDLYAVALSVAFEAYTGQRLSETGFQALAKATRAGFLKDSGYQGRSTASKQDLYEETMVSATDALRLRRAGDVDRARDSAFRFVGLTWKPSASNFFNDLAKYAQNIQAPASKSATKTISLAPKGNSAITNPEGASNAKMTPEAAWREAIRVTSFRSGAASIVPTQIGAEQKDAKMRAQLQKQAQTALESMHEVMRRSDDQSLPPNNVARAMAFAIMQLRQVARSTPGQPLGKGETDISAATMKTARRQIALNLASNSNFRALSDRDKQQMQEVFLILPAFALVTYEAGLNSGDLQAQQEARTMARQVFQELFKSDPDKVRFTADGVLN